MRLLRTIAPLSSRQISYLLRNRLAPPGRPKSPRVASQRRWVTLWRGLRWRKTALKADGRFCFLNEVRAISAPDVWHDREASLLWQYHLHYLDDLFVVGGESRADDALRLLESWIENNPPTQGVGWAPFPLSLRIVNIVKLLASLDSKPKPAFLNSLALQAAALESRLEYHLRANHLFENGKALLFAGCFLDGADADRWIRKGLAILDAECTEQFLADGSHFELSPMYHAVMMWNLCDLIALADSCELAPLRERRARWSSLLNLGIEWYRAMTHPDGEIAFFNDAAIGQAPALEAVERYRARLGLADQPRESVSARPSALWLSESGYLRVDPGDGHVLIIDIAPVGPSYQPGHAHADTLSFELSLFGDRVLVNSGTSTYERGAQRDFERGTAAHNCVVLNGRNSSDTWAGFRVGKRAVPKLIALELDAGEVRVRASHDGYRRLVGGATHDRRFECAGRRLTVCDRVEGRFREATAFFFFHPSVQVVRQSASRFQARSGSGHPVLIEVAPGRAELKDAAWHPTFGTTIPNRCLQVPFEGRELRTTITW